MNLIEVFILAIVQGITEWLPISSSGHLAIVQQLWGLNVPVLFDVTLHVGTLIAVLVFLRRDIANILKAVARLDFKTEEGKLAKLIVIGSIPTAVMGFLFKDLFESFFSNLFAVGVAFMVTGCILYTSRLARDKNKSINYFDALLIGTAQGIALIPGVSRSGITISTGLLRRVKKEKAFQYSFLLYIPAVIGAAIGTSVTEWKNLAAAELDVFSIVLGLVIAAIVGYVFLKLLFKVVVKEKFHVFAYYCWAIGLLIILTRIFTTF
jgi:undecaprenyl-diphosphatase